MGMQDLHGQLPHRTELRWQLLGIDPRSQARIVSIVGQNYLLGHASGAGCNCLVDSLRQCLGMVVDVGAIRRDLREEFPTACGAGCAWRGGSCERGCMKVYDMNYLTTDHWEAVIRLSGRHSILGPIELDAADSCVRVVELTWAGHGSVLGNPAAPRQLTIAREHGNHFIPALPHQHT